MILIRYLF